MVDELLIRLREASFTVYGYADNVAIIIRDSFLQTLRDRINDALKIVQEWCMAKALSVNPTRIRLLLLYSPGNINLNK